MWERCARFSALQRAEIAEMVRAYHTLNDAAYRFSALQRAEIAEIAPQLFAEAFSVRVSVLFNEPKLLKYVHRSRRGRRASGFSALQRAEIAEICWRECSPKPRWWFQCSSTSRNC